MELSPSTQTATLTYLKRDVQFSSQQGLRPYRLIGVRPTSEVPATNMQFEQYQMPITDLRRFDQSSFRDRYTLEDNGFQLFNWPTTTVYSGWASTSHTDDESPGLVSNHMPQNEDRGDGTISMTANHDQVKEYCRQMSNRLQEELGAEKTFLYEFRFRSNSLPSGHGTLDSKQAYSPELSVAERFPGNPAQVVHTDHSQGDGLRRLHQHLTTDEVKKYLLSGEYHIRCINIWRSFNTTSHDLPLALCIPDSITATDIQTIEKVTPEVCSESNYLYHNKNHQWVWVSNMMPTEVLAFTTWDSTSDREQQKATKCTFHTAFPNPIPTEPGKEHAPRESIEVRLIVIQKLA